AVSVLTSVLPARATPPLYPLSLRDALPIFNLIGHTVSASNVGYLLLASGQADSVIIEGADVSVKDFRGVAMRVDADKDNLYLVGPVSKAFHHHGKLGHRGRANVRTACVAEEKKNDFVPECFVSDGLAVGAN